MEDLNNENTQPTSPSNVSSQIIKRKYTFVKLSKNNDNVHMSPGKGVSTASQGIVMLPHTGRLIFLVICITLYIFKANIC